MFESIINWFNPVKSYLAAVAVAVVAVFIAVFKYRGYKVDKLENTVEDLNHKATVQKKMYEVEKDVAEFESQNKVKAAEAEARDYDEINSNFYSV